MTITEQRAVRTLGEPAQRSAGSDPLTAEARLELALASVRHDYHDLLAAARAAVAAGAMGAQNPLYWIAAELDRHGQTPPRDARPEEVAAMTRWPAVPFVAASTQCAQDRGAR